MAEVRNTILCIEDDRETSESLAEELAARDFDMIIAYDGHEGFVSILKNIPDLILSDIIITRRLCLASRSWSASRS